MLHIGPSAKALRESIGWTQRRTAAALDITPVHLCNFEKGKVPLTPTMLERYRELWGVDLYVLAWCEHGKEEDLPPAFRETAAQLAALWKQRVAELTEQHREAGVANC